MGIYTGGMRMVDEATAASKRIAAQQQKAWEGESKRKGRSALFGGLSGALMGTLAVGAMGLTGGLAAPLVMGVAASLGKKWADEASKGGEGAMFGDTFKTPGQVGKIEAGGKYGFGGQYAAKATKDLQASRKTEFGADTMLGDIGSAYLTAGLSGDLTGSGKALMSGKEGSLMESITGSAAGKRKFGWEGIKQEFGTSLGGEADKGAEEPLKSGVWMHDADTSKASAAALTVPQESIESLVNESGLGASQSWTIDDLTSAYTKAEKRGDYSQMDKMEGLIDLYNEHESSVKGSGQSFLDSLNNPDFAQGGQVPQLDQNTLIGLSILSQMQQQPKAHDNTPLEEEKQQPTITEMFASQGKTLGGNNTQSLSQMLGR